MIDPYFFIRNLTESMMGILWKTSLVNVNISTHSEFFISSKVLL